MMLGAFLFSYIVGNIQYMREVLISSSRLYDQRVADTLDFAERMRVPDELQHRVRNYYMHSKERRFVGEMSLLSGMAL